MKKQKDYTITLVLVVLLMAIMGSCRPVREDWCPAHDKKFFYKQQNIPRGGVKHPKGINMGRN